MNKYNNLKHIYDLSLFNVDDFDVLLHEILKQSRVLLNAEAGTIYTHQNEFLMFNVFQNDSLSYEDIYDSYCMLQDVKLSLDEGDKYLAVESFNTQKIIIIDDAYDKNKYDFLGVKEFDKRFDYRTKSIITIPLVHPLEHRTLGVLQLLNKKIDNEYVVFNDQDKQLLQMVSSFISIAVSKAKTDVTKLEKLNRKLEETNQSLEQRIKIEMSENEKKNAIIFHQSKLISMGEMIGNIAHQWRQPLSTISTIASGLSLKMDFDQLDEKEAQEQLKHVVSTTRHLSQTIDDFRNFFAEEKKMEQLDLSTVIKNSINLISASLKNNHIQVIEDLQAIQINVIKNELSQGILNILTNAKDVLCEHVSSKQERLIFIQCYEKQHHAYIHIKDNGGGIPMDILEKIYEPYFTTKHKSQGTGIGLYMTREIIIKHLNGDIETKNTHYTYDDISYTGAEFIIKIPL
jgi:signal transduction histidine kinase